MVDSVVERDLHRCLDALSIDRQRQVLDFARSLAVDRPRGVPGRALLPFAGSFPADDLAEMQAAIEADCEQIDPNGW